MKKILPLILSKLIPLMNPRALLIFAKEPRPGKVKTRMTPPWSPAEASELSFCFFRDTLQAALKVQDADRYLFFSPEDAHSFFQKIVPKEFILIPQQGKDFTERCAHSVQLAFDKGHSQIVQIGTDTPQIQTGHIEGAFDLLEEHDMGFGPTQDGGYYLLSLSQPSVGIYDGVVMGGKAVFKTMSANARKLELKIKTLPEWIDADTHADLLSLHEDPKVTLGPYTRELLSARLL